MQLSSRRLGAVLSASALIGVTTVVTGAVGSGTGTAAVTSAPLCAPALLAPTPAAPTMPYAVGITDIRPATGEQPLLATLRGSQATMPVHDYVSAGNQASAPATLDSLKTLAAQGYPITLTIDDEGPGAPPSTAVFLAFVHTVVHNYGAYLSAVEVTNEPNLPLPSSSDGANAQVLTDVVQGVLAAKQEALQVNPRLQIGFNYVYTYGLPTDSLFWAALKSMSTPAFRADIDFLGVHTYPNPGSFDIPAVPLYALYERQAFDVARCQLNGLLGTTVGPRVPLRITEVGYPTPTGTGEYGNQTTFWTKVLATASTYRGTYGIDQLFAFMLQDVTSGGPILPGFGLFTTSGVAKPAAAVVASAVAAAS